MHDKAFKKIFRDVNNTKDFLKKALPREIKQRLDFASIKIDPTNYVSNESGMKKDLSKRIRKWYYSSWVTSSTPIK